jgi:Ca2+-binding RTX toxin-like protein
MVLLAISAPTAASAATLSSDGTITYNARQGEVNRLEVGSGFASAPFTEYSAQLRVGAGCTPGTPVVCTGSSVVVRLGDRRDVASVAPFFMNATVFAGPGDDDVYVNGDRGTVDGGLGDDTLRVTANGIATATGDSGDDQIAGVNEANSLFDGGWGDDLIVATGAIFSDTHGGGGYDSIVVRTGAPIATTATASGDNGDDIITFLDANGRTDATTFNGGNGDDTISGPAATVDGGNGNDLISVVGGTVDSTVTCGRGFDVVWADTTDVVGADCERRIDADSPPNLPGVAKAVARANALLKHFPQPNPNPATT